MEQAELLSPVLKHQMASTSFPAGRDHSPRNPATSMLPTFSGTATISTIASRGTHERVSHHVLACFADPTNKSAARAPFVGISTAEKPPSHSLIPIHMTTEIVCPSGSFEQFKTRAICQTRPSSDEIRDLVDRSRLEHFRSKRMFRSGRSSAQETRYQRRQDLVVTKTRNSGIFTE